MVDVVTKLCPKCKSDRISETIGNVSGRSHLHCNDCGMDWREKNPAAVALGSLGGDARADALSPERRKEIATDAAEKRWRDEKLALNRRS